MKESESIVNTLLIEVESLTCRLRNIKYSLRQSNNAGLRYRLINENKDIYERIKSIHEISHLLNNRPKEKFNFAKLLFEKSRRTLNEIKNESNLFFL